jgi:hypothetical protein
MSAMFRRLLPFVCLLAAGCSGDAGSPAGPTPAAPTFRLTGTIRDASALILLPGITVSVSGGTNAGKSVVTGADGRYALEGLVREEFTLRTQHTGYEAHLQDINMTQDMNIDIRLIPKRTVASGWSAGQIFFTIDGAQASMRLGSIEVTQNGTSVSGSFRTAEGGSGSFSGRVDGTTYIGSLRTEFVYGASLDRRCRGFTPFAGGQMSGDLIALTAQTMAFENCAGAATNVQLTIQP